MDKNLNRNGMIGVIQVRMGSTRLPGKALKEIMGKPLLSYLYERVCAASSLDRVVIATAAGARNQPIVDFAKANHIGCVAGSEQDLVDRFCETAEKFVAKALVRVTGDCPFADPSVVDQVTGTYLKNSDRYDYVGNVVRPTYPDGLDVDVLPRSTLEKMDREVKDPFWREWLTGYLRERPNEYRIGGVENAEDLSALRWTVDYEEDLRFTEEIFSRLYPKKKIFLMKDILELLEKEPAIAEINKKYTRDAAYAAAKKEAGK